MFSIPTIIEELLRRTKCFERNQINVLVSYLWMKSEELRGHRSYYVMLFKENESLSLTDYKFCQIIQFNFEISNVYNIMLKRYRDQKSMRKVNLTNIILEI